MAEEIGQSVANTSFHLRAISGAGLVTTRRDGTRVYYRLMSARVGELRDVASAHHDRLDKLADGDVIVIDVRPTAEYEAGQIAGARSIPFDPLKELLDGMPDDVEVGAYCRGPYCLLADDAVQHLNQAGRPALRLKGGFPKWQRDALPIGGGT